MKFTQEQQAAINSAANGFSTEIKSLAGGGKTRVAMGMAKALSAKGKSGHLMYFGNANAKEGREKLGGLKGVSCSTFHSMAMKTVDRKIIARRGRLLWWDLARQLSVSNKTAYYAMKMVDVFCKTADREITKKHLRLEKNHDGSNRDEKFISKPQVLETALKLWDMQTDINGSTNTDFQTFLKIWALQKNTLQSDFIIVDEFQDTSPVNIGKLKEMRRDGTQLISIGDPNQAIMQFTGAQNAFKHIDFEKSHRLNQSFRNGQRITDLSALILNTYGEGKEYFEFTGTKGGGTLKELKNPHAIISRTNATVISNLLREIEKGSRPFVIGGTDVLAALVKSCEKLQNGEQPATGDLSAFKKWDELEEYSETELGRGLKPLVSAVKEYGTEYLIKAIGSVKFQRRETASVILGTGHRVKGLEFNSVQLSDDFKQDKKMEKDDKEMNALSIPALNLVYVATTRTLGHLDVSRVEYLKQIQENW